jgi:hypothetical protein
MAFRSANGPGGTRGCSIGRGRRTDRPFSSPLIAHHHHATSTRYGLKCLYARVFGALVATQNPASGWPHSGFQAGRRDHHTPATSEARDDPQPRTEPNRPTPAGCRSSPRRRGRSRPSDPHLDPGPLHPLTRSGPGRHHTQRSPARPPLSHQGWHWQPQAGPPTAPANSGSGKHPPNPSNRSRSVDNRPDTFAQIEYCSAPGGPCILSTPFRMRSRTYVGSERRAL